jgi:hypothetical protein
MASYLLQATGFQSNASDSFSVYYSTTTNSVEQLLLPCVNRNELLAGISVDLPSTTYGLSVHNNGGDCDCIATAVVWPSPSPTPSITPTVTPTKTPTPTVTPTITPTRTPSVTVTPTVTPSISISATPSLTPTVSPSLTPTRTPSVTATPTMTVTPTLTPTPTVTPTPSRGNVLSSGTVAISSGDAACTGGEAPFSSPPYEYYVVYPGTTLCDATTITTAGIAFDWINAEISTGGTFYVSDRVSGDFYYRQFTKSSAGSVATQTGACVLCGTPGVSPSPSAPIPQRNVRVFVDRPGGPSVPTQYLEYSLSTSPTSWVTSCDNISPAESLTPYVTIAVDNGVNINLRVYDTDLLGTGDNVQMDYAFLPATTPSTTYYTTATTNNQNDCGPSITITQDTDIYVKTSTVGCGIFPANPCPGPSPSVPL